ncbi:hypothetical protein HPB51_006549 [Rhipicephalus microplus]|uniref:Uncharacterized protein n=1 Tax=Rhipicephalus microplus TaxID=6941 RepID=A0A9J6E7L3_RHIMP|nr:hypothetical protein HPB51_006549 [Rhipicephalus microplus]
MEDNAIRSELLHLTCTQEPARVCQLLRHLGACNQFLWPVRLQLAEDTRNKPGHLSIVTDKNTYRPHPSAHAEKTALEMLCRLLERHRCIVSLELRYDILNSAGLLETLARSSSLRRLAIKGIVMDPVIEQVADAQLAEDCAIYTARMEVPICLLEKSDATLVSLDIADLDMSTFTMKKFIEALARNGSVQELAVGYSVFPYGPDKEGRMGCFLQYLTKQNSTLRKLTFRASFYEIDIAKLKTVAEAICAMTTLEDLEWHGGTTTRDSGLFLAALAQSRSVQSLTFQLKERVYYEYAQRPRVTSCVTLWVMALLANNVLQKLDLDVSWSSSTECCLLLEALSEKEDCHLQSLTLRNFPNHHDLREVCSSIQKCGLNRRVHIDGYATVPRDEGMLAACQQVTSLNVRSRNFRMNVGALRDLFNVMTTCYHVTSLHVSLHVFNEETFAAFTTCVSKSPSVKEILLNTIFPEFYESFRANSQAGVKSMCTLFEALSSNGSITRIQLASSVALNDRYSQALADAVLNNKQLEQLLVRGMNDTSVPVFLNRLVPGLEHNYNLLVLDVPPCDDHHNELMRVAQEMVRRNCSLVDRATRFVMGDHSLYCACAFERISEEPVLVGNVRQKVTSSEEANDMIRHAQRFVRYMDLNTYMRLTGVVKKRVECYDCEDGSLRLDQLYDECWLHIRRFLLIEDVLIL